MPTFVLTRSHYFHVEAATLEQALESVDDDPGHYWHATGSDFTHVDTIYADDEVRPEVASLLGRADRVDNAGPFKQARLLDLHRDVTKWLGSDDLTDLERSTLVDRKVAVTAELTGISEDEVRRLWSEEETTDAQ